MNNIFYAFFEDNIAENFTLPNLLIKLGQKKLQQNRRPLKVLPNQPWDKWYP